MLPEPFNALLWHAAVIHKYCSIEIATKGSPLYADLVNIFPQSDLILINNAFPESLTILALAANESFQIKKVDKRNFEKFKLPEPLISERYTIKEVSRNFNAELSEIAAEFQGVTLDLVKLSPLESMLDESLNMLKAFSEQGLSKSFDIAELKATLDILGDRKTPLSLTTGTKSSEFLFRTRILCNNYLRQLTNALIYDLHLRMELGVAQ